MEQREIEIRTWPETVDVLVIDVASATLLAHYEMDPDRDDSPLFRATAAHDERAAEAIRVTQRDQDLLKKLFHAAGEDDIELVEARQPRESIGRLLLVHGLNLESLSLQDLPRIGAELGARDPEEIYRMLVDWNDVVERHYPQGSSYEDEGSWVHRATPENCINFHYQVAGVEDLAASDKKTDEDAYELFLRLTDRPLSEYSFGFFLRWVYYHMVEFPGVEPPTPLAWREAGLS